MSRFRYPIPGSLAGRFLLLLSVALVSANLVALGLLSVERLRLDRAALEARETERITSLVPAIEAVDPAARGGIATEASTRFSRVTIDQEPIVEEVPEAPRSRALTEALVDALPGRDARAAIMVRRNDRTDGRSGRETIAISVPLAGRGSDDAVPQWLNLVSRSDRRSDPDIEEGAFLMILGLSLVSVLGVGWLFVRRLTRPLSQLSDAARAAGRGDRTVRVREQGARELRDAAAAFNDMQARIAGFDSERMRTLAAVGHDLRTPITSLRIRAELLDEADAAPMIRTLDEMTVMAEGLVSYAKGAGEVEETQCIDMVAMLRDICGERGASFEETSLAPMVDGRRVALTRAFGNLMDNALCYGNAAHVRVAMDGNDVVTTIEDDGPGIPPERLDAMFEPFVRGEDSRSRETGGAGLGLSIARNILMAHGGSISLANRPEGGLRVVVSLPTRRPD
ncbi:ATP-binding protein [Tropicimonas marinistellae]|uniref:ATP-binding protein n=1 Tax=Tropicimonas marinistellae TaxID=1739787 RepID=UPI00082B1CAE|nr:ATP-binding protein [Tropicimonas marinistellae]